MDGVMAYGSPGWLSLRVVFLSVLAFKNQSWFGFCVALPKDVWVCGEDLRSVWGALNRVR